MRAALRAVKRQYDLVDPWVMAAGAILNALFGVRRLIGGRWILGGIEVALAFTCAIAYDIRRRKPQGDE